jgi:hypothetical protein
MEARIPILLLETVGESLHQWSSRRSLNKWGITFLKSLLNITHRQWVYRNADVHHKVDGLTTSEHETLFMDIRNLMHTVPGDLLHRHRHLLNQDFHDLGNHTTLQHQLWVASMTSAIKAAHTVLIGNYKRGSLEIILQPKHSSANRHPSTSHHSQLSNNRARYTLPHWPRQQKLPSTLWTPLPVTALPQTPPVSHPTDLTGTRYNLHWKQK